MERRRVLIVDGRKDNADALGWLLRVSGYEVLIETDGHAALASAKRHRPDAVLLDLRLPGLSGYELCAQVRREPWGKSVLLIALTGWTRESDRAKAREAGFDYYVLKPVSLETLETLLRDDDRRGAS